MCVTVAVISIVSEAFDGGFLGFSAALRTLYSADVENKIMAFGAPGYEADRRGLVWFGTIDDDALMLFNVLFIEEEDNVMPEDQFGFSLAIAHTFLYIGAPAFNAGSRPGYVHYASPWDTTVPCVNDNFDCVIPNPNNLLSRDTPINGDQFGYSLALDAFDLQPPYLLATSMMHFEDDANGCASIFELETHTLVAEFYGPDDDIHSHYGYCSAVQGHIAAVGAPNKLNHEGLNTGMVYLYNLDTFELSGTVMGTVEDEAFGYSVAIMGTSLVIGAPGKKCMSNSRLEYLDGFSGEEMPGSVYYYEIDSQGNASWVATITHDEVVDNSCFGASVGISDTEAIIIIGAPFQDSETGSAYHYEVDPYDPTLWTLMSEFPTETLDMIIAETGSHYGHTLTMDNLDRAIVGVPMADGSDTYEDCGKGTGWLMKEVDDTAGI